MPEQNPLPFPDAPKPTPPEKTPGATDPAAPGNTPDTQVVADAPVTAGVPMTPPAHRQAKRPLWARLLGRVADPWLP